MEDATLVGVYVERPPVLGGRESVVADMDALMVRERGYRRDARKWHGMPSVAVYSARIMRLPDGRLYAEAGGKLGTGFALAGDAAVGKAIAYLRAHPRVVSRLCGRLA